ncbi:MAG: tetratricopeptide repeat protein [Candidatus Methanofastidiosum sp.]|nr:tetratricopeptide repeat protein [Methanofastidiosum sp.]
MEYFHCPKCKTKIKSNTNFCYKCGFELRKISELIMKGDLFFAQDKHPDAIDCFDQIIKINSNNAHAWYGKGKVLLTQAKNSEDVEFCVKCQLCPILSETFYEDAIKCFNKAIEINPEFKEAWLEKGVALDRLGKSLEAKNCFSVAKELKMNQFLSNK